MNTHRDDLPAFPCDTSVSMAFAVFENAHKPFSEEDYTALRAGNPLPRVIYNVQTAMLCLESLKRSRRSDMKDEVKK